MPLPAEQWSQYPITHGYITDYQGPGTDTPHYAFDLATPLDTQFAFPKSGIITQADYAVWNGKQGGGEIFLKPDDGTDIEYAYHLDVIEPNIHSGSHVYAGQLVGLTGGQNTGGQHPTDPMWSSGPHLHVGYFEQYVNTPDGSRPYGPNPQSLIDYANQFYGVNTPTPGQNEPAIPNPAGDTAAQIADLVQTIAHPLSWFSGSSSGLLRVGMFVVGGIVIIGGIVLVGKQ